MPQMSSTWWFMLFLFNIFSFLIINVMIYFKWSPFYYNLNSLKMKKIFLYNDKNF